MPQILFKKVPNGTSESVSKNTGFDSATFEIFFNENFSGLCAYCQYRFGFDIDLAKEAVHSGFIKLWENRETLSANLSVKAYLYTIVSNICLDILRHDKVKQKHEKHVIESALSDYNKNDFDNTEFNELKNNIDKAVSELPEQMRTIFELSRYEGLKYSEIAAELSISIKTVETQMSRALVKLRSKLSWYLTCYLIALIGSYFS